MDKKYYHRGNGEITCYSEGRWPFTSCSYRCDPSNPVGWIEGEEVYQALTPIPPCGDLEWLDNKEDYDKFKDCNGVTRIWIEPKREQPHQPDFQREAGFDEMELSDNRLRYYEDEEKHQRQVEELQEQVRKMRDYLLLVTHVYEDGTMVSREALNDKAKQLLKETE